jgi:NADPH oxidase
VIVLRNLVTILRPRLQWLFPADENIWVSPLIPCDNRQEADDQFHKQVAYQMVFWTMVHTTAHYVNFFNVSHDSLYG